MKQKHKILLFCMIIVGNSVFCQQNEPFKQSLLSKTRSYLQQGGNTRAQKYATVLPADFSCTQSGYFCKKEWMVESVTKIPFRFRLGSLQYNDWLEGKKNAGLLPAIQ
jgi:hypothetical protein